MTNPLDPASIAIKAVIKLARAEVGTKESPRGSNRQKYGKWYGMNGARWCDIFISWVGHKAGVLELFGGKHAYTPDHAGWFKKKDQWTRYPAIGDIVFYTFGYGRIKHVGLVTKVHKNKRGKVTHITAIEGNTGPISQSNGGMVMERYRSMALVAGFGRPKYPKDPPKPPKPKPAPSIDYPLRLKPLQVFGIDPLNKRPNVVSKSKHVARLKKHRNAWAETQRKARPPLVIDDVYDIATGKAMSEFRRRHGLGWGTVTGPKTWKRLFDHTPDA